MKLLLLDGPRDFNAGRSRYRGTYRAQPTYHDSLPETHEINTLFFWFLEEGGESGVIHDLAKAKRYTELLNRHVTNESFEVIEVIDGDAPSTPAGKFLGFDLSRDYNSSLLYWGFERLPGLDTLPEPIRVLCELLNRCYKPQLNSSGLFETCEVALSCLRSMIALQTLSANLFEGDDLNRFRAIGIVLVYPQSA